MLFPALGMTTAMWLLVGPLLGVETGLRAALTVGVGFVALVLSPLSLWSRRAGQGLAALGILLGLANFVLFAPIGAYASLASCATALIAAGMAPAPSPVREPAAVAEPVPAPVAKRPSSVAASPRLPAAA
jgi:hypothetical protein